ncbi:MAG: hypothetical protein ACRDZR_00415 [Acidimicrobiales bacterium]
MSRTYHHGERRIRIRGVKKDSPDFRRLARALLDLAKAEAEAEAQSAHRRTERARKQTKPPKGKAAA